MFVMFCMYLSRGTGYSSWLRHCATIRKVTGSKPDETNAFFFFSIYLILAAALDPGVR
jgi:hypothetical protein